MNSIQTATKTISNLVSRACITQNTGLEEGGGCINVQVNQPSATLSPWGVTTEGLSLRVRHRGRSRRNSMC
jgi:hypothetical protein